MNIRPMNLIVGLLTGFTLGAGGSPAQAIENFISMEGRKVGVTLVPEKPMVMLDEPATVLFTLHNHSDTVLWVIDGWDYRNKLGRQDSFKVSVHAADGKQVPQPDAGSSFGGMGGAKEIPAGGTFSVRLFLPHWAQFTEPGTYAIVAKKQLSFLRTKDGGLGQDNMVKVDAQAATTISLIPRDHDRMGELIDAIGASLLAGHDDQWPDGPAKRLAAINDERVIPWFVKAFATHDYERKFAALNALAKFDQVEAFNVLKAGMDTKGEDIGTATTPELDKQSADNIRHGAAAALTRSPYPGAKTFLISRRNDPSIGVRITVLHVLGQMPREEALPILQEMSQDQDTRVSNEAKRYIGLLTAKK